MAARLGKHRHAGSFLLCSHRWSHLPHANRTCCRAFQIRHSELGRHNHGGSFPPCWHRWSRLPYMTVAVPSSFVLNAIGRRGRSL
ncbi:hypothetical protein BJY00DRAFT_283363 [Aspergillus carlsbadensis]|nr:hypothetical protein BJY00DRAFT_283363 [Aspergillus carlsbadensis]